MKKNKKTIRRDKLKKFCSILLSILFAIVFLATILLGIVRNNFSYSTITRMAGELFKPVSKLEPVNDGLFHPEDIRYSLAAYEDYSDFDFSALDLDSMDFTNLDVKEIVQTYLDAAGVDVETEFIAEVLASPEVSDFVDKYAGEVVSYLTGSSSELKIDADDIKTVMNKSLDMYEEHTGEVVDRTGLDQAIEENVAIAQTEITSALDSVKEENAETFANLKYLELLLSLKLFLLCIGLCVLLALILFLINRNIFTWLLYAFIPVFTDGILMFVAALVLKEVLPVQLQLMIKNAGLFDDIYNVIWAYISVIINHIKIAGIICALAGTAFWASGISLGRKKSS